MSKSMTVSELPATLLPVADSTWSVSSLRQMRTYDGAALHATVRRNGKIVGTFENEGTGGGTWFRPASAEAAEAWNAYVAATTDLLTEDEQYLAAEFVCERLVDDYEIRRILDRAVKRGVTPYLAPGEKPDMETGTAMVKAPLPQAMTYLSRKYPEGGCRVWRDGAWTAI